MPGFTYEHNSNGETRYTDSTAIHCLGLETTLLTPVTMQLCQRGTEGHLRSEFDNPTTPSGRDILRARVDV